MTDIKRHKNVFHAGSAVFLVIVTLLLYGGYVKSKEIYSPSDGSVTNETKIYEHSDGSFSFTFPVDFTFSTQAEKAGTSDLPQTILFKGNSSDRTFQIRVSAFSTDEPLTKEVILKNLPDLYIEEPQVIAVAGAKGLAFISGQKDGTFRTREIWFTYGEKLYQVTTTKSFNDQMINVLASWQWK